MLSPRSLAAAYWRPILLEACKAFDVVLLGNLQVREIGNQVAPEPFRWTAEALLALQEVSSSHSCVVDAPCGVLYFR